MVSKETIPQDGAGVNIVSQKPSIPSDRPVTRHRTASTRSDSRETPERETALLIGEVLASMGKVADRMEPDGAETRRWMVANSGSRKVAAILKESPLVMLRVLDAIGSLRGESWPRGPPNQGDQLCGCTMRLHCASRSIARRRDRPTTAADASRMLDSGRVSTLGWACNRDRWSRCPLPRMARAARVGDPCWSTLAGRRNRSGQQVAVSESGAVAQL